MAQQESNIFQPILARLGEAIGIPDLALDEASACMLEIDGQLFSLQWSEEAKTAHLYAVVGAAEHGPRALPLYTALLEANCLGRDTGGLALGLHAELDSIVLSGQVFSGNLEGDALYRYLECFVGQAKDWTRRIQEILTDAPEAAPSPLEGGWPGLRI
ncbi:MAG: type III secretion system chaperone [Candidatus Accumulibacter sp.]|jgi:hypothetical protein|nr:type III secretion system chaperone [Accumulibacter sp.]